MSRRPLYLSGERPLAPEVVRGVAAAVISHLAEMELRGDHQVIILATALGGLLSTSPSAERQAALLYGESLIRAAERTARQARHEALLARPAGRA